MTNLVENFERFFGQSLLKEAGQPSWYRSKAYDHPKDDTDKKFKNDDPEYFVADLIQSDDPEVDGGPYKTTSNLQATIILMPRDEEVDTAEEDISAIRSVASKILNKHYPKTSIPKINNVDIVHFDGPPEYHIEYTVTHYIN